MILAIVYAFAAASGQRWLATLVGVALFVPAALLARSFWNQDDRRTIVTLAVLALVLRIPFACSPPLWSNDAYRYVWDGRLSARGIDPRGITPNDPLLVTDRASPLWRFVDLRSIPTVYPPVALALFEIAAAIDWDGLIGAKIVMIAGDAFAFAALLWALRRRGLPRGRSAVYALHPLVLVSFAQDAHIEAYAIAGIVLAIAATRPAQIAALSLAVLTKLYPLILVPLLFARDRIAALATVAVVALAYLPSLAGGHLFGSLHAYVGEQQFNQTVALLGTPVSVAVVLTALMIAYWLQTHGGELVTTALLVIVTFILCSPNVLPWYATVIPPLLALERRPFAGRFAPLRTGLFVWSVTVVLAYAVPWFVPSGSRLEFVIRYVEYSPILAGLIFSIRSQA